MASLARVEQMGWTSAELAALGARDLRDLYRSPAVLAAERERLFSRSWSLVTTSEELAAPGSFVALEVAGAPILVVRDRDFSLLAFHNLCRHRSIKLVEGSGRLGRFLTCPYHQWSFELDGRLANVPERATQFDGLDPGLLSLHRAAVAEWQGMVFVNPLESPPPFAIAMAGLDDRLAGFDRRRLVEVARVEYEAPCNWKLLIENHVDVYHLRYLHARSLSPYDHARFRWEVLGDNWWSLEPLKEPASAGSTIPWLEEDERVGIGAHLVFPNLMVVTTGRYFATYDACPLSPERTRLTLRVRAEEGTDPAPLVEDIRSFLAEDLGACSALQEATGSVHFGVGALARTHEAPVRAFHASLRNRLLDALG